MAASLIFRQICQKGIFFTFCLVIHVLLTIYFSKYLQFLLNTIRHCQNYVNGDVFLEDNGHWKCKFFIFGIFFPRLWRTLARKLMERPAVFITYFQSTIQIVHVYQILRSEYFFQKFVGRFNLMSTFFAFHHFCEKTYEKTYRFYDLFSNFRSLLARSQNLPVWIFFSIKWRPFLNVNNFLFISATLSNICDKTYEKTYRFFKYFETSTSFLHVYKICRSAN